MSAKHIVFIVTSYLPNPSAGGICANNIIDFLKKKYKITVITSSSNYKQVLEEKIDEVNIIRNNTQLRNLYIKKKDGQSSLIEVFLLKLLYLKKKIKHIFSKTSLDGDLERIYLESLIKVNEKDRIDYIIPLSFPFEGVTASIKFKDNIESKVEVYPLLFDKFSDAEREGVYYSRFDKKYKLHENQSMEKEYLKKCQFIFFTNDWKKSIDRISEQTNIKHKKISLPTLNKKLYVKVKGKEKNSTKTMLFGGVLNKSRPAKNIANTLDMYNSQYKNLKTFFYCPSNMESAYLSKVSLNHPDKIFVNTPITLEEIRSKYKKIDILCSIGNKDITQTPSKIFEYISTGKPIIHFYHNQDDPVIALLDSYQPSLCIFQNDSIEKQTEQINQFVESNIVQLSWFSIKELFKHSDPEYITKLLENKLIS